MRHHKQPKKRNNTLSTLILLLLFGILGAGCSDSGQAPPPASTPVAVKPGQQPITQVTPTVDQEKHQEVYTYNAVGRRDPFAPIVIKEEKKAQAGDRPPLERYSLYDFKLAGVVWGGFGYNAMVEGPDGKGYLVRVGTIIGPNKGVVKKIAQDKMVIEEKYKNFSGETERKEIVIELRKKQEGMQ